MSAFVEVKSDFLRAAAQAGWTGLAEVSSTWRDSVPPQVLSRWLRQLSEVIAVEPSSPKRLVNHFKLGADPEFVFIDSTGARTDATSLGFKAAQAWGADNNGRLCEIRPTPSRHALAVTASVWATLVWMSKFVPASLTLTWRSGAWIAGDGIGGHIHFGRKRPTWPREMQALDTLAFWLQHLNIFSQAEWRERVRRTRGRGNYGQLGDRRQQVHGWEYRTIPSWLDSPWMAFCILTLSKLAVFDPEFFPPLTPEAADQPAGPIRAKLRGLLSYYKGRDDDAALAYQIFFRLGWPHFDGSDFKSRWGIFGNPNDVLKPVAYTVPNMVPATPAIIKEFGSALVEGRVPEWTESEPSWSPATLPKGYIQALSETTTFHHPGVGELVRDLVVWSDKAHLKFVASANTHCEIPTTLLPKDRKAWQAKMTRKFPAISIGSYEPERRETLPIFIPGTAATDAVARKQLVAFLTDGWAPIWLASEVKDSSYAAWIESRKTPRAAVSKPKRIVSKAVWPAITLPKPKEEVKLETVTASSTTERIGWADHQLQRQQIFLERSSRRRS